MGISPDSAILEGINEFLIIYRGKVYKTKTLSNIPDVKRLSIPATPWRYAPLTEVYKVPPPSPVFEVVLSSYLNGKNAVKTVTVYCGPRLNFALYTPQTCSDLSLFNLGDATIFGSPLDRFFFDWVEAQNLTEGMKILGSGTLWRIKSVRTVTPPEGTWIVLNTLRNCFIADGILLAPALT
jgi:hypothetical protein